MATLATEWWGYPDELLQQIQHYQQIYPDATVTTSPQPGSLGVVLYWCDGQVHSGVFYHQGDYCHVATARPGYLRDYLLTVYDRNSPIDHGAGSQYLSIPDIDISDVVDRLSMVKRRRTIVRSCPLPVKYHPETNNMYHFVQYVLTGTVNRSESFGMGAVLGYLALAVLTFVLR